MSFYDNIEQSTLQNNYYRRVIYTTPEMQLVYMSLRPQEEIGMEKHPQTTQFIRIESGTGLAVIGTHSYLLKDGIAVIIPPNTDHNIINISSTNKLKLYTLYSPPEHSPNTLIKSK